MGIAMSSAPLLTFAGETVLAGVHSSVHKFGVWESAGAQMAVIIGAG